MSGKFGLTFLKAKPLTAAERAEKYQSLRSDQVASVFGGDDSDEEDGRDVVNESLKREAVKQRSMKKTQKDVEKALEEDASVFQYDELYDEMNDARIAADPRLDRNTKDKPKPKARYINNLIKSAEERKKLDFLRKENAAERERRLEGEEYADKDEFVTEAFKTHLEELREFEQREKEEAEQEARQHSQTTDLTGFYRNLLDNNQAFGTAQTATTSTTASSSAATTKPDPTGQVQRPDRHQAKRDVDRSAVRLEPEYRPAVQYFEPASKQAKNIEELTEEEQAKYSRKTSSDAAAAAKARALARRKQKKRPQRMED